MENHLQSHVLLSVHQTLDWRLCIPQIGLGTWPSKPDEAENAIEFAIRAEYRHLDLAMVYGNQHMVGAALKSVIPSTVQRPDLFITSKLWNSSHRPEDVDREMGDTLEQLGLDHLDLYFCRPVTFPRGCGLHPPQPKRDGETTLDIGPSFVDTWEAMIDLPYDKVRAIGVSNFTIAHLEGIIATTGIAPAANQVEAHPFLPQDDLWKQYAVGLLSLSTS